MDKSAGANRQLIPFWRPLARTPSIELTSSKAGDNSSIAEVAQNRLRLFYERWKEEPTLENALEVVDVGLSARTYHLAVGAAEAILASEKVQQLPKKLARLVIEGPISQVADSLPKDTTRQQKIDRVRSTKARLLDEPRNGLLWLEGARLNIELGNTSKAEHFMHRALACAPENRFVLRAFARLMCHLGAPEVAHMRLSRSESIKTDPWVQATELSLAQFSNRPPRSISSAKSIAQSKNIHPIHLSEVRSALGTIELMSGSAKKAKPLFSKSLTAPTDNSLAQAFWARDLKEISISIDERALSIDTAFEARMQQAITTKDWSTALRQCELWTLDEPFSLRAATTGSFISSALAWDQERSLRFCEFGGIANKDDRTLTNNRIVSLCRLGRTTEAETLLSEICAKISEPDIDPVLTATQGLLGFRKKDYLAGRACYERAVQLCDKSRERDLVYRVRMHWLYEEAIAGTLETETVDEIVRGYDDLLKKYPSDLYVELSWDTLKNRLHERRQLKVHPSDLHEIPRPSLRAFDVDPDSL